MADTVTYTKTLDVTYKYTDGDTRTIKFPNPMNNITENVQNTKAKCESFGELTLSDKGNEDYESTVGAVITITTKLKLDLEDLD